MTTVSSRIDCGWARIKFLYDSPSSVTATSEDADHPVSNILNRLETNYYLSASTATQYITASGTASADYVVLYLTNLLTAGCTVVMQYSSDNFAADINDAFTAEAVTSDTLYFKEFTKQTGVYWRLKITGATAEPMITIGYWGEITELDYCSVSFDPNAQRIQDDVNVSETGYLLGVYEKHTERTQRFAWNDAELDVYDYLKAWHNEVGRLNFFTAWDTTDHPEEIFLMRTADGRFEHPYINNGRYRNASVNLTGRKLS